MIDICRTYWVHDAEPPRAVVARVFDAAPMDHGADWSVRLTVEGLDPKWASPRSIYGVDELQAVLLALKLIRTILDSDPSGGDRLTLDPSSPGPTGLCLDV